MLTHLKTPVHEILRCVLADINSTERVIYLEVSENTLFGLDCSKIESWPPS